MPGSEYIPNPDNTVSDAERQALEVLQTKLDALRTELKKEELLGSRLSIRLDDQELLGAELEPHMTVESKDDLISLLLEIVKTLVAPTPPDEVLGVQDFNPDHG